MKLVAVMIPLLTLVAACGGDEDTGSTAMAQQATGSEEVTYCSCVTEPEGSGARARACKALIDSMSPNESVEAALTCREKPPAGGPDLCFCVQTSSTDPEIRKACEAIIPENLTRAKMTSLFVECSRKGR